MPSPELDTPRPGLDRSSHLTVSQSFTFFPIVKREYQSSMFLHDRDSMAIMSHEIEANLSRIGQSAEIFAGFQRFSKFLIEEQRYRLLAAQGHAIFVFGVPDVLPPPIQGINYISITENDALAREWFVIADTSEFYSALVAEELLEFSSLTDIKNVGPKGLYQGIWTFDPLLIAELVHHIRDELGLSDSLQTAFPLREHFKQIDAIVASANHLVNELELRKQALDRQQRRYEDLVNMLVHDLRGSLTSVIGSLELLASGRVQDPGESQELINNSLENSRRLSNMISNILDLNKFEAGRLPVSHDLINLPDLLVTVLTRWKAAAGWSGKSIETSIAPDLPVIIGDAGMLERVLDNLLSNAIKYGSKIILWVRSSKKMILISVIDDGPGIPVADRQVVFEKFMQANLGNAQRKGTGLGLAFCKMAVEAHGGSIQIYDAHPNGTEFRVELPISSPHSKNTGQNKRKKEK